MVGDRPSSKSVRIDQISHKFSGENAERPTKSDVMGVVVRTRGSTV